MTRHLIAIVVLFALLMPAISAFAQTDEVDDVVILKFMTSDTDEAIEEYLYRTLEETINAHPGLQVTSQADVSVNEMVLVLGCDAASPECIGQLSDFAEGDLIVYGNVERSSGVYLFNLKLFDFQTGDFRNQIDNATLEGSRDKVEKGIDALVSTLVFGNVGELEVSAAGADSSTAYLGKEELGPVPLSIESLPLGEHTVTVEAADGRRQEQVVTLRPGKTAKVHINFALEEAAEPIDAEIFRIPGWASMGVGAVGLAAAIIATVNLKDYNKQADMMVCGRALCEPRTAEAADALQADLNNAYTMSVVGYSVAAVGIGLGSYFLYHAYSGGESDAIPASDSEEEFEMSFGLAPHKGGASVGFNLEF